MTADLDLRNDVMAELALEPSLGAESIGVGARDGIVTLSGHVGTHAQKLLAAKAAGRVAGVRALALELDVQLSPEHRRSDSEIAAAVLDALATRALVPVEHVRVVVDKGWVTLWGDVEWHYERDSAERALQALPGVVGVSDLIEVRRQPTPQGLAERIQLALERQAQREARRIRIEVRGDEVVLRGDVNSGFERDAALGAVVAVSGVGRVFDELRVRDPGSIAQPHGASQPAHDSNARD